MKARPWVAGALVLAYLGSAHASRVEEALKLERNGKLVDAVRILKPCLDPDGKIGAAEREDCLYQGERLVLKAVAAGIPGDRKAFDEMGILPEESHYGGHWYQHDFFRELARAFPKSRYAEEFVFVLRPAASENWRAAVLVLEEYVRSFPKGPYIHAARFQLALIHDNLWDVIRPEDDSHAIYREDLGFGRDAESDRAAAEEFRLKAISLYQEFLSKAKGDQPGISEYSHQLAKRRASELRDRKGGSTFAILND